MQDLRKVATFAIAGALGCLAAAVLGQAWLMATWIAPARSSDEIALVLDCSGSMDGPPLEEMKRAAQEFVGGRDLSQQSHDKLAVIGFGDFAQFAAA